MDIKGLIDTEEYLLNLTFMAFVQIEGQLINIVEIFNPEIDNNLPTHLHLKKLVKWIRIKDNLINEKYTSPLKEMQEYEEEERARMIADYYKNMYIEIPELIERAYMDKDNLSTTMFIEIMVLANKWRYFTHGEF